MTAYIPDLFVKDSVLNEKLQQYALINGFIESNKGGSLNLLPYIQHAKMMASTINMLEYDIKIALGDDVEELVYWEEN